MSLKRASTKELTLSWDLIESFILTGLEPFKAIPKGAEPLSVSLDYAGGFQPRDKKIKVRVVLRDDNSKEREVKVIHCR